MKIFFQLVLLTFVLTLISIPYVANTQGYEDGDYCSYDCYPDNEEEGGGETTTSSGGGSSSDDDDDWDDWWADWWDDHDWDQGAGDSYGQPGDIYGNPFPEEPPRCPRLESRTNEAPNRSRTEIGIGEEVRLRIRNDCGATVEWEIEGPGRFKEDEDVNGTERNFEALWEAGTITITATLSNLDDKCSHCEETTFTLQFTVYTPSGIFVEKTLRSGCGGYKHIQYRPSAGIWANIYVMPDNVNFYRIKVIEGAVDADPSGPYFEGLTSIPPHPTGQVRRLTSIVSEGKGTKVNSLDDIDLFLYCDTSTGVLLSHDATLSGQITYNIPQFYIPRNDSGDGDGDPVEFDTAPQVGINEGGENSLFTISKSSVNLPPALNASHSFRLEDGTTNLGCIVNPPSGCN